MSPERRTGWTRRRLLASLARSPVAISAVGWLLPACTADRDPEPLEPAIASIVAELEAALPGHRIEREALIAFAEDLEKHRAEGGLRSLDGLEPAQRFLLSSDLFVREAGDLARPIHYVAFYDPYLGPCRNPLPRRIIPGDEEEPS